MIFTQDEFKTMFPEFSNVSEAYLELMSEQAECFVNKCQCKCGKLILMLMTAHLLFIFKNTEEDSLNGVITNATIDKVSVALKTLDTQDSWVFWLNQSTYGQTLLALIKFNTAGGYYMTGRSGVSERSAFRGAGGVFPNNGRARRSW